jgi:hypothetical protein
MEDFDMSIESCKEYKGSIKERTRKVSPIIDNANEEIDKNINETLSRYELYIPLKELLNGTCYKKEVQDVYVKTCDYTEKPMHVCAVQYTVGSLSHNLKSDNTKC